MMPYSIISMCVLKLVLGIVYSFSTCERTNWLSKNVAVNGQLNRKISSGKILTFAIFSLEFCHFFFLAKRCDSVSHLICDGNQTPLDSVELTASSEYNSDHAVDQICLNNQPYGSKTGEFTQSSCAWASPGNFTGRGIIFSEFFFACLRKKF